MNKLKLKRLIYRIQHDYLTLNNVVIAAAILIAMSWAWGSIESMQKNYELQRSIDNKRQQVEIEKLQVALLEYESKYYQSEEYQELTIRQRTGKGLPGEKQLITQSFEMRHACTKTCVERERTDSNFQQWMNFLFGGNSHKH
ncbi:hypothetical protein KOY48_05010 [Candidatus Minimicrobia naudis]|uniref:Uncharacterized protein n=1 Tax=Candidatus Minimicrobia naudis TaxID=2841263 RepID=A0A8F1SBE5_9BACT|nr:hypothetical protein KOY48_05010 [Candidatus Minimicrobia naudis]